MKYPPRFIKHVNNLMAYLERHDSARSADLVDLGIDKSYLSYISRLLISDGYITRKRIDGGYTYYFVKRFEQGEIKQYPRHEMQNFFYGFVRSSLDDR